MRRLAARVASRRVGVEASAVRELPPIARRVPIAIDPQRLDMLADTEDDDDGARPVVELHRSDASSILEGAVAHRLSGLAASERLGPFRVGGLADVWFDLFFAARTRTIVRSGEPRPLLVLGKSRAPTTSAGTTTVALEAGTIRIRGDLLSGGLAAGAYVGIEIAGGALTLTGSPGVSGDQVTISGGLAGKLVCKLAAETVDAGPDGRRAAQAVIELPEALTFDFTSSGVTVDGTVCERYGVLVLHGPPHRPQFYGQLERQNREHRAWLEAGNHVQPGELPDELDRMRAALNGSWQRRTLNWVTAELLWQRRRIPDIDRADPRARVDDRAARLATNLPPQAVRLGTHYRLAIENELVSLGFLNLQAGGWC